jgi:LysR family transcriptional regulator, glycine cleavage system transcriptional activator
MNEWIRKKRASAVPLLALLAFEVAARHMSIKDAADELSITPSAVSHRLRQLEKILGCRLFQREGSQIALTAHGQMLAPALSSGFAQIMEAVGRLQYDDQIGSE